MLQFSHTHICVSVTYKSTKINPKMYVAANNFLSLYTICFFIYATLFYSNYFSVCGLFPLFLPLQIKLSNHIELHLHINFIATNLIKMSSSVNLSLNFLLFYVYL